MMEQEIKAETGQRLNVKYMEDPTMNESNSLKNGLGLDNPIVTDPIVAKGLQKLVLDENQSRRTQKPELQSSLAQTDTAMKISIGQSTTNGTKPTKPTTGSFVRNSNSRKTSEDLKDRFITLNVNLERERAEDYKIYLDCEQFDSSDVKVSIEGDFIVVRAKHQCKFDDHGLISREFTRRWLIPEDVKRDKLSCFSSRNRMLIIKAPRKPTSIVVPVEIENS